MSEHTRGPWSVSLVGNGGYGTYQSALVKSDNGSTVANVNMQHKGSGPEVLANTHLIVAATDLLAFISSLAATAPGQIAETATRIHMHARELLAKAKGENR